MRLLVRRQDCAEVHEPRAFLSTSARGLVIEQWRRRELERAWLEALAQLPVPGAPSPESRRLFLETLIAIDAMLGSLEPQVRNAFLWAQLEGLTCRQIATRLDVSPTTVERYIATALRHCYALRFER